MEKIVLRDEFIGDNAQGKTNILERMWQVLQKKTK